MGSDIKNWTLKKRMLAAAAIFFLFSTMARAGSFIGSPHDFRKYSWDRSGAMCLPCHVPHSTTRLPAPMWDHELSTQTYTMYGRIKPQVLTPVEGSQPDGLSKICLSCHDGIIAPDAYCGNMAGAAYAFGGEWIRTRPGRDHPISFVYDTALARDVGDLYDPATKRSGLPGSKGTIQADMLFFNRVECASCHDVHNTKAVAGTKLLVKDNAGSALCLTCHNK